MGRAWGPGFRMYPRYWLIHANGGKQLIDPEVFDLETLAEQVRRFGARLEEETPEPEPVPTTPLSFEPPVGALAAMFRARLERIYDCREPFLLEMITRPTRRSLGNYYRSNALIKLYTHDAETGRRPFEELFGTFLHEVAHHLEYTEFDSFNARACGRRRGTMHSKLFWRILGELKGRWEDLGDR